MSPWKSLGVAAGCLAALAVQAGEADPDRGRLLYENHCTVCHTSTVHIRENSKARNAGDLRYWITRWQTELGLGWSQDEMEAVVEFLDRKFYRFGQSG